VDLAGAPARCRIAVQRLLADIAIEQKDYAAAAQWCSGALAACEQAGEHNERGPLHYLLAVIARCTGRYEQAQADARQATALAEKMGDIGFQALALYEQSRVLALLGELEAAERLGREALALMRSCRAAFNEVYALNHLGEVALRRGEREEAVQRWQTALAAAELRQHPLASTLAQRLAQVETGR
jgi:tetratricopeptide (TPR) repeat protein